MKKIVCLVLALIVCLTIPMTALAATNSPSKGWFCQDCNEWVTGNGACSNGHTNPGGGVTPPTGDTSMINMWIIIMIVALAALCVAVVFFRRTKKA